MFTKLVIKLTLFALKRADLSLEDRNLLTGLLLERLGALPLRDTITNNEEGKLLVNGRSLDLEGAIRLRASARAVLGSPAYKIVYEQVAYEAVNLGTSKAESAKEMIFARAALWWSQQEISFLKMLAGSDDET